MWYQKFKIFYSARELGRIRKISTSDIEDFLKEVLAMLLSGLTVNDAIFIILKNTPKNHIKTIIQKIYFKLGQGKNFSSALSVFKKSLHQNYFQILIAGEKCDKMVLAIELIVEDMKEKRLYKEKIKRSIRYPASIFLLAILICIGLLIFVVPEFSKLYNSANISLPCATLFLIKISNMILNHTKVLIFISLIFFMSVFMFFKSNKNIFFFIPFFKNLIIKNIMVKWLTLLAMMLQANMALPESLIIANKVAGETPIRHILDKIQRLVLNGHSFSSALGCLSHLPMKIKTMLIFADQSDALRYRIAKIANTHQAEFADYLDNLSKLIEPVMMVLVAVVIAVIALAIYLPVFRMGNLV
ncbi:MAG: hypothetical protein A3E84_00120 [Gammaproteobacteria bacterium RIFCSPHIGHO2_12_FULL_42_13]|nr:MAG: hypothetical protein A3E84_00120 [Gammaproteobacteria bacterium RIFCSPHIGHO2_12_FULL_42_13]